MSHLIWIYSVCLLRSLNFQHGKFKGFFNFADAILSSAFEVLRLNPCVTTVRLCRVGSPETWLIVSVISLVLTLCMLGNSACFLSCLLTF